MNKQEPRLVRNSVGRKVSLLHITKRMFEMTLAELLEYHETLKTGIGLRVTAAKREALLEICEMWIKVRRK